jgi:predicted transcriptional regulator
MGKPTLSSLMTATEPTPAEAAEYDSWFRRQVQAGLEEANAGRLTPGDEVEARFTARREKARHKFSEKP